MSLFGQIKSSVNSILPELFGDPDLTTVVTWKEHLESVFDEDAGYNVDTYKDHKTIPAIRVDKDISSNKFVQNRLAASQMGLAVGDNAYLFKAESVPIGASIRDVIVEEATGMRFSVKRINPIFGLIVKVEVKGYA